MIVRLAHQRPCSLTLVLSETAPDANAIDDAVAQNGVLR